MHDLDELVEKLNRDKKQQHNLSIGGSNGMRTLDMSRISHQQHQHLADPLASSNR